MENVSNIVSNVGGESLRAVEFLASKGWVELSNDLDHSYLVDCYDLLTALPPNHDIYDDRRSSIISAVVSSSGSTRFNDSRSRIESVAISDTPPSVLQFFFDLYKLSGDTNREPYKDILISYLLGDEQRYEIYDGDTFADIETFLTSIKSESVLVFTGRFRPRYSNGTPHPNALADNQKSVNAICVDIDPLSDGEPLGDEALRVLFDRVAEGLEPSYISLSGNGFHLWYMFDESIQLFTTKSKRRERFKALANYLYDYMECVFTDCAVKIDRQCANLSRGFRAPCSLTKSYEVVRCFCHESNANAHCTKDPLTLIQSLMSALPYKGSVSELPTFEDVRYIETEELEAIEADRERRKKEREEKAPPATDSQLAFIQDLYDQGFITESELNQSAGASTLKAGTIIGKGKERRSLKRGNPKPDYENWTVPPHRLNTDAIYQTILRNIQSVEVGRRYGALYMLAGVAYMTTNPEKTVDEVRRDFMELLSTPWAKKGNPPLTKRDIEHALLGYKKENWRSKRSEIDALGFNPFNDPQKRNGRTRELHLAKIARPAYREQSHEEKTGVICDYLAAHPKASKSEVSRETGISYPTVLKYWKEACASIGIADTRSGNYSPL